MTDAGPNRLEMAGAIGYLLGCACNLITSVHLARAHPEQFRDREVHAHGPTVHLCAVESRKWKKWKNYGAKAQ
jgi:uncharacterized protein (UPF0261 family)